MSMENQQLWSLEEAVETGELEATYTHLPGVRCGRCGKTWAFFGRLAVDLTPAQERSIRKVRPPCSSAEFKDLVECLDLTHSAKEAILPGTKLGCANIKRIRKKSPRGGYFSFSYEIFVEMHWYSTLEEIPQDEVVFVPTRSSSDKYVEIVPTILDARKFGARVLCNGCGRYDPQPAIPAMIAAMRLADAPNIAVLPGATVISETLRVSLEQAGFTAFRFKELPEKA